MDELIKRANAAIKENENDYRGKDGILRCGNCGTPKEVQLNALGKVIVVRCLCKCEEERQAEQEAERKRKEKKENIERLRKSAFSECSMAAWTFAADDEKNAELSLAARRYADNFSEFSKKGKGLLLCGQVGTGKTYAACCIANALIENEIPVLVTDFARLSNEIGGTFDGKQEQIDKLNEYKLLVIDDLGAERKSEYMQEMVFNIIDARYRSGLPMIITTNLTLAEIKDPANIQYSRIYDRIIERCFPIEVNGKSRRRAAVREDYAKTKEMLGL